jgi:hypothetical protein
MAKFTNPLDGVRVAAPCPADWSKMVGDERVRYCGECNLHVYNLSGMTRREAETLITNAEGRLCVRFYRRADGTVLTRNCPVGLRALKRRVTRIASATLTAVLGFFAGVGLNFGFATRPTTTHTMGTIAVPRLENDGTSGTVGLPNNVDVIQGAVSIHRPAVVGMMVRREDVSDGHKPAPVEGVRRRPER